MKVDSLRSVPAILILNWIGIPMLSIWVLIKEGIIKTVLYLISWWVIDTLWDKLSDFLILCVGKIGSNAQEEIQFGSSEEIPIRVVFMMVTQVLINLVLPWFIAGYFLHWF